ncbi:hypothetical protein MTO96_001197 [Rhipicephalus appendiculatus]
MCSACEDWVKLASTPFETIEEAAAAYRCHMCEALRILREELTLLIKWETEKWHLAVENAKAICSSASHNRCLKKHSKYLPSQAVSDVVDEFETSTARGQASTYDDFVGVLSSVIQKHMVWEKYCSRAGRKPWWDAEVKTAWQARCEANCQHSLLLKSGDKEACLAALTEYLDLKHKVQTLVQEKIAQHNVRSMAFLKEEGKSASQKFWRYAQSLDWKERCPVQLRNAVTGEPVLELKEHITSHLCRLYGRTEASEKDEERLRTRMSPCPFRRRRQPKVWVCGGESAGSC